MMLVLGKETKSESLKNGYYSASCPRAESISSGPSWRVPTGRKDGRISLASQASILPSPLDSVAVQKQKFEAKGLDTHDLVTLLGAHTIGQTDCLLFRYRLYNYTVPGNSDPTISPSFLTQLKTLCPPSGDGSERVALDIESPSKFDVSFFKKLRDGNGILESDQRLWSSDYETSDVVNKYASTIRGLLGISFDKEFAKAMVKMGSIEVKIGVDGAHTIGQTDCLLFRYRLYNYTVPGNSDPTISPSFLTQLKTLCPPSGDGSERVALDIESPSKFDVSFFKKLRDGNGILESDQRLWSSDYETSDVVNKYASTIRGLLGISFDKEFAKAMVKMGSIEVKIGVDGEDQGPSDDQCYSSSPAAIAAESSQHHLNLLASASSVATTTAVTARTINTASVDLSSVYTATAPRINSFITAGTSFFASPRNLKFEMYKIETVNGEMSLEPENMRMKEWLKENVKEEEYVGMKAEFGLGSNELN
ncbi:hypothetical protein Bca52824_003465 [Brassica carinata]|uniref:peroxidase n=1 Tax=Brassica carinata TaxID=52824 RepID=A0A8X7WN41_BRACI|nr:hypothetical protein Bca52824_003465 [Brassica carinata]